MRRAEIGRQELVAWQKRGAHRFIQLIEVRAAFRSGSFFGWRITRYAGPGPIRRGDVVFRVNGQPIERPEQVMSVWNSMAEKSALGIDLLRDGRWLRLYYRIVQGPSNGR